jgi:hypothetical protein
MYRGKKFKEVKFKRFNVAIICRDGYEERLINNTKRFIKVINRIESAFKWRLSKAYEIDEQCLTFGNLSYAGVIISAPNKWAFATQLMSLYLLLFRLCKHREMMELKTFDDFEAVASELRKGVKGSDPDVEVFKLISGKLKATFEHKKELFFFRLLEDAYAGRNFSSVYGIQNLLTRTVADKEILNQIDELRIEERMKIQ